MTKYRSKPVEIEAVQLTTQRAIDYKNEVERMPEGLEYIRHGGHFACHGRQGFVLASVNDWIIQELDGSGCYPCAPDVFSAKYEPIA